jgi:hypothetical protein
MLISKYHKSGFIKGWNTVGWEWPVLWILHPANWHVMAQVVLLQSKHEDCMNIFFSLVSLPADEPAECGPATCPLSGWRGSIHTFSPELPQFTGWWHACHVLSRTFQVSLLVKHKHRVKLYLVLQLFLSKSPFCVSFFIHSVLNLWVLFGTCVGCKHS